MRRGRILNGFDSHKAWSRIESTTPTFIENRRNQAVLARLARLARYLAMTVVIFLFAVVLVVHGQGEDYRQGTRTRFDLVHQSNSARGGR